MLNQRMWYNFPVVNFVQTRNLGSFSPVQFFRSFFSASFQFVDHFFHTITEILKTNGNTSSIFRCQIIWIKNKNVVRIAVIFLSWSIINKFKELHRLSLHYLNMEQSVWCALSKIEIHDFMKTPGCNILFRMVKKGRFLSCSFLYLN